MAAKIFYRKGFLLLLFIFISNAALDKRFSDLKRCADEECSMLLVRGKAIQDFSGPDCRFLSFKKSETIYVYYKLSGRRADMWAGSVGSRFGYFPKDLLAVNHIYTEKEIEVSAEETDFVCFDTGYDKFDDYDVDSLLGLTTSMEDNEDGDTSDPIEMAADTEEQTQPAVEESAEDADQTDDRDDSLDLERVPEEQSASMLQPVDTTKSLATEDVEHKAGDEVDGAETDADDTGRQQRNKGDSILESVDLDRREAKGASASPEVKPAPRVDRESEKVSSSVGKQIPELKTTFGTTFDAVTTDDEVTWKVTPYEEGESEELKGRGYADGDQDAHDDNQQDTPKGNPLLLTAAKPEDTPETDTPETDTPETDTPETDLPDEVERPQQTHGEDEDEDTDNDDPHTSEDGGMWTSLGDKVFAIVSGGEKMARGSSSEEDEDEDEGVTEEETAADEPLSTREGTEDIEPPPAEPTEETRAKDLDDDGSPLPLVSEDGDKQTDEDDTPSLLDDEDDENPRKVVGHEPDQDKSSTRPADEQGSEEKPPEVTRAETPASRGTRPVDSLHHKLDIKTRDEPIERETAGDDSEVQDDDALLRDDSTSNHSADTEENKTGHEERSVKGTESEEHEKSNNSESTDKPEKDDADGNLFRQYLEHSLKQFKKKNSQKKTEVDVGFRVEEELPPEDTEGEEKEVLLEDENAISSSESHTRHTEGDKPSLAAHPSTPEPDYSDSILRLTLLREHFKEEDMGRLRRFLSLTNLFKVEAMLSDLDLELQAARLSDTATTEDIEKALDSIMEASENYILDEIEKMLDGRDTKNTATPETDESVFDEEAQLLDEFQEIAFRLRQKYSAASDSTPLTPESDQVSIDEHALNVEGGEKGKPLHTVEEEQNNVVTEEKDAALGDADAGEAEQGEADEAHKRPDINVEKDGGHFNANKDNHPSYSVVEEMQKGPQAILDNPFDMGLIVEMDPSGSLDSVDPVSDFQEEEWSFFSSGLFYTSCIFAMIKTKICDWIVVMISLLPEEWKPGESPFGCPWQAVAGTAFVGIMTVTMFFWKSVLAVKKREYLVDEKGLNHQIKALKKEKSDAILRMSELQQQTEELKEKQKQSEETTTCALKRNQDLESKVLEAERQNKQVAGERQSYAARLKEEREKSQRNDTRIEKLEKSNEKLQQSRKKTQEALAKTTVLLDEAKLREEARNIQHKCLERDYAALKEQNTTLKVTIIGWEDKHKDLSEQIKVYQKSQKELEDSVVLKDHNVEVLSDLLADLDACDMQRNDGKVLANGEVPIDKKTAIKNRIKQMMDVSRVQTTLSVVEDERNRFMTKLLNEEKARKALEENHQDLEHTIAALKSDKSHVENQFKILQQKNEIMTEMYQQKENALQQRLTKEELERRSKESLLSEVGGKAVEAEEQVKVLRQRINEMEEQMKKTEEVYKEQIKEQENKTHSNWVNARNAERALNQEKVETSKLREKLAVLTSQLNERRAPLFRPNSGQLVGPRQGDSYGPSPVSGGAPSPPPMIEGPRRPPSAPVGRRIDPYGPRPPSDPHGRYLDNKHTSGIDINAPRTSSPSLDDSTEPVDSDSKVETATHSPEPGPGSFSSSCIVDSPGSRGQGSPLGPPAGMGHSHPPPPPGPHSRLQHPGPHRLPRPGPGPHGHLYHPAAGLPGPLPPHGAPLPANGHPGLLQPSLIGAEFGPRPSNGHALRPRLGPGHTTDPRGQPPLHFRPPPPHHFGPMPPPHGMRGPMGPRPPFPPDMRFPGPWDHPHPAGPLFPGGVPPHRDAFVQGPPERPNLPGGPHPGPGQDQDLSMKPEAAPQDSVRSAMAEP